MIPSQSPLRSSRHNAIYSTFPSPAMAVRQHDLPRQGRAYVISRRKANISCAPISGSPAQDEYYDIDFWVNQKTGKLEVDNVKVHK